jgi:3-methyladenine DNA glycosylase AlkD
VVGYLQDKSREPLYRLARSDSQWKRRTAIVATYHFIKRDELDDTFAIAEILVHDDADLVRKAVGGWIRQAGKRTRPGCCDSSTGTPARCPAPCCGTR